MKIRRALLVLILVVSIDDSYAEIGNKRSAQSGSDRREQTSAPAGTPGEQDQAPVRQSLPPEKKKSLHGISPDELFPGAEETIPPPEVKRSASPRPRSSPRPTSTVAGLIDGQPPAATAGTTPAENPLRNSPQDADSFSTTVSKKTSIELGLSILGLMSVATLLGLLFTIFKLRDLLRDR